MRNLTTALLTATLAFSAPALAQQSGLVNVNLGNVDVLNNLAKNLSVDVKNIPVTVQVPIGVAANICNIGANVLAKQVQKGTASCDATSSSNALTQVVQKAMTNKKTDTGNTTNTGGGSNTGGGVNTGGTPGGTAQSGLVNLNLGNVNVLNDLAKNLSVDVKNIPVTVQVPIDVAANVCDISANVLAKQLKQGTASCDAKSSSAALTQIVQKAMTNTNTDTGNTTNTGGGSNTGGNTNTGGTAQSGLVNLNLGNVNVLNDLAKNLSIDVKNIPVTVQVPIDVAANVCDISANVLAEQLKQGKASCDAKSSSAALAQIVQKAMTSTNTDTGNTNSAKK